MAGVLAAPCGRGILRKALVQPPHEPMASMGGRENLTHLSRSLALPGHQRLRCWEGLHSGVGGDEDAPHVLCTREALGAELPPSGEGQLS